MRSLSVRIDEIENNFAEAGEHAIKGRAVMAKLESRTRELTVYLGNVKACTGQTPQGFTESEQRSKTIAFQLAKDKSQHKMAQLATQLQQAIRVKK